MVLDGEEDETLRVLLENGLVGLVWSNARGDGLGLLLLNLLGLDDLGVLHLGLGSVDLVGQTGEGSLVHGVVLLVGGIEVELLNGRLHLEGVDGGSSLLRRDKS